MVSEMDLRQKLKKREEIKMNEIDNCGAQVKEKNWNCCGKQIFIYDNRTQNA